jgi:FkbM family methyltransferase
MSQVISFHIANGTRTWPFQCFAPSAWICEAILKGETYPLVPFLNSVSSIVDVGANVGAASFYFAMHFPNAKVYAFEPDPTVYRLLCSNVKPFPNVTTYNVGLFNANCRKLLYRSQWDPVSNSIGKSDANGMDGTEIVLRDASEAFRELGLQCIDILKIDTEGCEVPILKSAISLATKARALYIEYHSEADRREIDSLVADTHILYSGKAGYQHRGEFCYVNYRAYPSQQELGRHEIRLAS